MAKRSYSEAILKLGFTVLNGKPKCVVCLKVLSTESIKKNKLQRHFETNYLILSTGLFNFLNAS